MNSKTPKVKYLEQVASSGVALPEEFTEAFELCGDVSNITVERFGDTSNVIVTFGHHKIHLSEDLPGCPEEAMIPENLVP